MPYVFGEEVSYILVDYNEVDNFVREHLGKLYPKLLDYKFVALNEANNYSKYTFDVDGILSKWEEEDFVQQRFTSNRAILNKLCQLGLIESGQYLVDVSW